VVDRKLLPLQERYAVQIELKALQKKLASEGKDATQAGIGELLGGVSQPAIGKALNRAEMGPTIRDALLDHLGLTRAELLRRHTHPSAQELESLEELDHASVQDELFFNLYLENHGVDVQDAGAEAARKSMRRLFDDYRDRILTAKKYGSTILEAVGLLTMRDPKQAPEYAEAAASLALHRPEKLTVPLAVDLILAIVKGDSGEPAALDIDHQGT